MEDFSCVCCGREIDEMNEGWHCRKCGVLYALCYKDKEPMEFVVVCVLEEDVPEYTGMHPTDDAKIRETFKKESEEFADDSVLLINKTSKLCYAQVGKGNTLPEPAEYIWRCRKCEAYRSTCSD